MLTLLNLSNVMSKNIWFLSDVPVHNGMTEILSICNSFKPTDKIFVKEGRSEVLLGPDNDIEFLKHFMNILKKLKYTLIEIIWSN